MAAIGGVTCTFVRPEAVHGPRPRGQVWQMPGVDGYGAQVLGEGDSDFRFVAVYYAASAALADAWIRSIEDLQYSVVSVTDDFALTYTNLLITRVTQPRVQAAIAPSITTRAEVTVEGVKVA